MISVSRKNRPSRPFTWLLLLGAVAFAAGCSTAQSPNGAGTNTNHILPSGSSVAGWMVAPAGGSHASTATLDYIAGGGSSGCMECHGSDLTGGIARVSCFGNPAGCHHDPVANWAAPAVHGATAKQAPGSSGFASCQICHARNFSGGGAGIACADCHGVPAPHPARPWRGGTLTHTNTNVSNAPVCAQCHFPGSPNNPANHPATPAPAGTPPGCFNSTLCHGTDTTPHPVPFNDPVHDNTTSATFTGATFPPGCITCHDVSAPSTKVGPVCQTCHVAASPLTSLNCTSCHALPPDSGAPAGAAYPNVEGAHAEHIALTGAGNPISCDTCHNGLGPSLLNLNHYDRAKSRVPPGDVAFLATYNAESGASSFSSAGLSCSNVSCHGGQATPAWQTGAINVDTQCSNCHAQGTAQFNSYNSGEHQVHVAGQGLLCTFCHNTTTLAVNHFTTLSTSAMEGPASATIGGGGTLIPAGNYDPATQSCSPDTGICHGTRTW